MASDERDVFGLTADDRAELRDWLIDRRQGDASRLIQNIMNVIDKVVFDPPLNVDVDRATAFLAVAMGFPVEGRDRDVTVRFDISGLTTSPFSFRILPKPAPKPEPKWISAEEAAVALLCKRQAVRCKPPGESELLGWWYVADMEAVRARTSEGVFIKQCTHMVEFTPRSQWCIVNSETGEAIETEKQ